MRPPSLLLVALLPCVHGHLLRGVRTASYSEPLGYQFYKLASAAYCGDAALANWSCAPCVASNLTASELQIFHDRKTDARGFVAMLDGSVVLSFEGTETLTNWLDDLKFAKTDRNMSCAGCKVHSGFYDCWKGLDAPMVEHVRALREAHPAAPVYVTGHSLGAAIAVIAAYILQYDLGVPIAGVYTYGGPRVGNRAFASYYSSQSETHVTWRHTHHRDPVPHLPLEDMGFAHVANEVYYPQTCGPACADYTVCDGSGEDGSCADQFHTIAVDFSIHDHLHYFDETVGENACADGFAEPLVEA